MTCALCYGPSNGFGWMEPRRPMTPIRKRWLFCSRRCLEVFITLRFGEPTMLDPVVMNTTALKACLNPLGQYLDAAGLNRPLADHSQDEVLALIDTLVMAYRDSMLSQYEAALVQERLLYEHPQKRLDSPPVSRGVPRDSGPSVCLFDSPPVNRGVRA